MSGLRLAFMSAWARRLTLSITVMAVAVSTCLLLLMERVRQDTKDSFMQAVSGVDLVVGPRSSGLALVLQSVFHVGQVPHTLSWSAYENLAQHPSVAWTAPLLRGDSVGGFPVIGTSSDALTHLKHGDQEPIKLAKGRLFSSHFEAVVGHEVAHSLHLELGQPVTVSHGMHEMGETDHDDKPMTVVGILAPTASPIDRSIWVSLESITALHLDWMGGAPLPGFRIGKEQVSKFQLQPKELNSVLVGLKQRTEVFKVQRQLNQQPGEALVAVIPGVALDELWVLLAQFERSLKVMGWMVTAVGLAGLMATLLAGLNERRRELAVMRALGASPSQIMMLVLLESFWVTVTGLILGLALRELVLRGLAPWVMTEIGIRWVPGWPQANEWRLMAALMVTALAFGLVPAWRAWKMSLTDGLMPRS